MSSLIIDVREPDEYAGSHIDGAINIPLAKLSGDIKEFEGILKDTQIVFYCRTGRRSSIAVQLLRQKGYTNLVNGINQSIVKTRYLG